MDDKTLLRYSSQIMTKGVDVKGQSTLLKSHIAIVGLGGLGCSCALYLAGSGIGRFSLVDHDRVELQNLPRQVLFSEDNIGEFKVEVVASRLKEQFSSLNTTNYCKPFSLDLLQEDVDVVVDCGDNIVLSKLLSSYCQAKSKPLVHASVNRLEGYVYTYLPDKTKPIDFLFRSDYVDESCSQLGILTPAVGVIASLEALQVIRVLLSPELGDIDEKMLFFSGNSFNFTSIKV